MSTSTDDLLAIVIDRLADAVAQRLADRLPPAPPTDTDLVDGPEMARRLRISQSMLHRMRAAGKVPCVRIGRRVLYRFDDVIAALREEGASSW